MNTLMPFYWMPFSKLFGRMIYDRIINFIKQNNIISITQYGFRNGLSTEKAIINFNNKIHIGLVKGNTVLLYIWSANGIIS